MTGGGKFSENSPPCWSSARVGGRFLYHGCVFHVLPCTVHMFCVARIKSLRGLLDMETAQPEQSASVVVFWSKRYVEGVGWRQRSRVCVFVCAMSLINKAHFSGFAMLSCVDHPVHISEGSLLRRSVMVVDAKCEGRAWAPFRLSCRFGSVPCVHMFPGTPLARKGYASCHNNLASMFVVGTARQLSRACAVALYHRITCCGDILSS